MMTDCGSFRKTPDLNGVRNMATGKKTGTTASKQLKTTTSTSKQKVVAASNLAAKPKTKTTGGKTAGKKAVSKKR
jgi:hypothetical protein